MEGVFLLPSLEDEMDQTSVYWWNLLEGNEKTVAGTNYKCLKELVARMLDCGYFESVPDPPIEKKLEILAEEPPKKPPMPELDKVTKTEVVKEPESFVEYMKPDLQEPIRLSVLRTAQMSRPPEVQKPIDVKCIKPEAIKPWSTVAMVKVQEPKRWQSSPPLIPLTKPFETVKSTPQPLLLLQKKCEADVPKERRERAPKMLVETKPVILTKEAKAAPEVGETTPMKRREVPAPLCINHHQTLAMQPHRVLTQPATEFCSSPTLPKDPELRKQKIDDLIDEIKGTCNFMQDSMLEFQFPSPKVASSQRSLESPPPKRGYSSPPPPKLSDPLPSQEAPLQPHQTSPSPPPSLEQKHEASCPVTEPADLPSPVRSPVNIPVSPVRDVERPIAEQAFVTSPRLPDPLPERNLTPVNLPGSQLPSPKTPTNSPLLQLQQVETPLYTRNTPVSAHTSPFQGMQTVFKVNAPLPPPRKEMGIREDPAYSPEYQQTFTTASTQTLPHGMLEVNGSDLHSLGSEPPAGPYPTSGISPISNGSLPSYTSTPNILPRLPQPCLTPRGGTVRGTSRGARILTNGYRCQTAFKGPEGFRGTPCVSNGTFGHLTCPGRDYPGAPFIPREANSHLCHKRGSATQSTRSTTRSWNDPQMSSPEHEESFNSTDSGQGDSRNMSSMDVSLNGQAATILPVHVYPLPQQMRVAFSSARTSNFAPGTLDQPIIFDLLLNNLGDTFDFQVGRFMCPVNGTYVFIFHMLKLAVNVPLYVNLMKNDEVMVSAYANDGAPDHETASNHAVLQLYQGDQIWLRLHRGAIYGSSWKYSTFSGYLLYQD